MKKYYHKDHFKKQCAGGDRCKLLQSAYNSNKQDLRYLIHCLVYKHEQKFIAEIDNNNNNMKEFSFSNQISYCSTWQCTGHCDIIINRILSILMNSLRNPDLQDLNIIKYVHSNNITQSILKMKENEEKDYKKIYIIQL